MRLTQFKNSMNTNLVLKIVSLLLGYQAWLIIGNSHSTTMQYRIPLYFYQEPGDMRIAAPEYVTVYLRGTQQALRALATEPLAAHIDAQTLHQGQNRIALSEASLFLPRYIQLISSNPSPVTITVEPLQKVS